MDGKRLTSAVVTYISFFGSRFVGNDIQVMCGSLFDTAPGKTVTLFAIMYQASQDVRTALYATIFFMALQYTLSLFRGCGPYIDKTTAKNVRTRGRVWASLEKKGKGKGEGELFSRGQGSQ
jgi:hypothetical protein